jgi:hypothetical protein
VHAWDSSHRAYLGGHGVVPGIAQRACFGPPAALPAVGYRACPVLAAPQRFRNREWLPIKEWYPGFQTRRSNDLVLITILSGISQWRDRAFLWRVSCGQQVRARVIVVQIRVLIHSLWPHSQVRHSIAYGDNRAGMGHQKEASRTACRCTSACTCYRRTRRADVPTQTNRDSARNSHQNSIPRTQALCTSRTCTMSESTAFVGNACTLSSRTKKAMKDMLTRAVSHRMKQMVDAKSSVSIGRPLLVQPTTSG